MLRRIAPPLLAAVALAIALGGCGDDSLTAAQLHDDATAICARTAAATDRIPVPDRPAQGERFLAQGVAELRPAVERLRALKAPKAIRARYDRAVQLAGRELALIARHQRGIAAGDDPIDTYRKLDAALEPLLRQENAYWRGLQLDACVRR